MTGPGFPQTSEPIINKDLHTVVPYGIFILQLKNKGLAVCILRSSTLVTTLKLLAVDDITFQRLEQYVCNKPGSYICIIIGNSFVWFHYEGNL